MQEKAANISSNAYITQNIRINTGDNNSNSSVSASGTICPSLIFIKRIGSNTVSFRTCFGISKLIQWKNIMKESKQFYIYILTNKSNRVLYVGMTNNFTRRIHEHKDKLIEGFTKKYNLTKLVYYEITTDVESAISREKQLKSWHRDWKINLINKFNPQWDDLSECL